MSCFFGERRGETNVRYDLDDQVKWQLHQRHTTGPVGGDAGIKHIPIDGRHDATCDIWSD